MPNNVYGHPHRIVNRVSGEHESEEKVNHEKRVESLAKWLLNQAIEKGKVSVKEVDNKRRKGRYVDVDEMDEVLREAGVQLTSDNKYYVITTPENEQLSQQTTSRSQQLTTTSNGDQAKVEGDIDCIAITDDQGNETRIKGKFSKIIAVRAFLVIATILLVASIFGPQISNAVK